MRMIPWVATITLTGVLAGAAWRHAVPGEAGVASLEMRALAGRDDDALHSLQHAAWLGSTSARLALGEVMIARSGASNADLARGLEWLRKAADAGSPKAHLSLGKAYLKGAGRMPADYQRARQHFEAAAAGGLAGGAYYLGLMNRGGQGMPRDAAAAARWLEIAADGGIPSAMFLLANMALEGDGMPVDVNRARAWLERAAELEHPEASQMIAMGLYDGSMGFPVDRKRAALQMTEAAHSLRHRPSEP
jgi:TPR repeat protein